MRRRTIALAAPIVLAAFPLSASSPPPTVAGGFAEIPWEGGPSYYESFPVAAAAGWADPNFFPIGIWYYPVTSQDDIDNDLALGINTYVELTPDSDIALIRDNGMFAITSEPLPGYGAETVGWLLHDEADMWAGAGDARWTGDTEDGTPCDPPDAGCGYTVMADRVAELPSDDGRMLYSNFGKGVVMWLTDDEAAPFVNDYTDLMSTDVYWYTDPFVCDELPEYLSLDSDLCRFSANYGINLTRSRQLDGLDGERQPIFADVEVGAPFAETDTPITPEQLRGAVFNSLIHGARGIIYFGHNFGGPCTSHTALRDQCGEEIRPTLASLNAELTELAPVLNSPSLDVELSDGLDTMLKYVDGSYYLFAMLKTGSPPGDYGFVLPDELSFLTVDVLYEDRSIEADNSFTDTFEQESSYHVYRLTPSSRP